MAYGTVPVVHSVGGLRDTVHPFNPFENTGVCVCGDAERPFDQFENTGVCVCVCGDAEHPFNPFEKTGAWACMFVEILNTHLTCLRTQVRVCVCVCVPACVRTCACLRPLVHFCAPL
jgi:hypothetical protein